MLRAIFRLVRFDHAVMLSLATFISILLSLGHLPSLDFYLFLVLLIPMFVEVGAFSLNDFLDLESDRANKRLDRPLVTGELDPNLAFYLSWFSFGLSVFLSLFTNLYLFLIVLFFVLFSIIYNYRLKLLPVLGNIFIAFSMAIPFVYGNLAYSSSLSPLNVVLFILAFILGFAREVMKDCEDIEGDKLKRGAKTLPIVIGVEGSLLFSGILFLLSIPLSAVPFLFYLRSSFLSLMFLFLADILLLLLSLNFLVFKKSDKKTLKDGRKLSLLSLFFGLLSFLSAVFSL